MTPRMQRPKLLARCSVAGVGKPIFGADVVDGEADASGGLGNLRRGGGGGGSSVTDARPREARKSHASVTHDAFSLWNVGGGLWE